MFSRFPGSFLYLHCLFACELCMQIENIYNSNAEKYCVEFKWTRIPFQHFDPGLYYLSSVLIRIVKKKKKTFVLSYFRGFILFSRGSPFELIRSTQRRRKRIQMYYQGLNSFFPLAT